MVKQIFFFVVQFLLFSNLVQGQDIELFQQFNGRYDYLAFGNTLNTGENTDPNAVCEILTESSADLFLGPNQTLIGAYIYWAGSGSGDFEVTLNGTTITAERTFSHELSDQFVYFAAYADITALVAVTGNGTYTLSDLTPEVDPLTYCSNTTNFGGWAINVIYEDPALPLNQVSLFDGMEGVSFSNPNIEIVLNSLNVIDNIGAKIGFLAWEGDANLMIGEALRINGNVISNPPLNPANNQFNSTNSFTGSSELYQMDIDFYDIENNIQPGDETAVIRLSSFQDLVMVNNIITVLNNELPDATISMDSISGADECGDRDLDIDYTVRNVNSTAPLPAGTSIGFYANNLLLAQTQTNTELPIGGSESGSISLTIPDQVPADFLLRAFVDDDDMVTELDETNNEDNVNFHLLVFPEIEGLIGLELCDVFGTELFDLTEATSGIDPVNTITYHLSEDDALNSLNAISNPESFENTENPQTIWIRVFNADCFVIDKFEIEVIDCPLPDATIEVVSTINPCRMRDLTVEYVVYNLNGTALLPAGTPIAFYIDNGLVAQSETVEDIPEGGSETGSIEISLSEDIPDEFTLKVVVDDDGTGMGTIVELNDFNNEFEIVAQFQSIPPIANLPDLLECDEGFDTATFDLTVQNILISNNTSDTINYFTTLENAIANTNSISDPEQYQNSIDPQTIYVRLENEICFATASFLIATENCAPEIPEGISPNGDGLNDVFKITNLIDVYEDFQLKIYSREGNLIYEGGNQDGLWDGIPNRGLLRQNKVVPVGTYFYVLALNHPEFPDAFLGAVYVNY